MRGLDLLCGAGPDSMVHRKWECWRVLACCERQGLLKSPLDWSQPHQHLLCPVRAMLVPMSPGVSWGKCLEGCGQPEALLCRSIPMMELCRSRHVMGT